METQTKNTVTGQMIFDSIQANQETLTKILETLNSNAIELAEIDAHLDSLQGQLAALQTAPAELHEDEKDSRVPHCPECGHDVWDNRADPERGKRPLMKCKDAACGWVTWKKSDCRAAESV